MVGVDLNGSKIDGQRSRSGVGASSFHEERLVPTLSKFNVDLERSEEHEQTAESSESSEPAKLM